MTVMAVTLDGQGLEHPLLMRVGPDIKVGELDRRGLAERAAIVLAQRDGQLVAIDGRVVRLEVLRGPVALERHADAVDDVRRVHRRQPHVPLQAVEECCVREIRRADECGRQAGRALEQPRLRVQLGRASVERDANLGTESHKLVDGPLLRRAHVSRRDDPDASAARLDAGQGIAEVPNARPDDEGADQVDGIGGRELRA
jgi:hypothetical protein